MRYELPTLQIYFPRIHQLPATPAGMTCQSDVTKTALFSDLDSIPLSMALQNLPQPPKILNDPRIDPTTHMRYHSATVEPKTDLHKRATKCNAKRLDEKNRFASNTGFYLLIFEF